MDDDRHRPAGLHVRRGGGAGDHARRHVVADIRVRSLLRHLLLHGGARRFHRVAVLGSAVGRDPRNDCRAHLHGAEEVEFGGVPATSFTYNPATGTITAVSPAGAAGTVAVTVVTPGGATAVTPTTISPKRRRPPSRA